MKSQNDEGRLPAIPGLLAGQTSTLEDNSSSMRRIDGLASRRKRSRATRGSVSTGVRRPRECADATAELWTACGRDAALSSVVMATEHHRPKRTRCLPSSLPSSGFSCSCWTRRRRNPSQRRDALPNMLLRSRCTTSTMNVLACMCGDHACAVPLKFRVFGSSRISPCWIE